jgi:hypothetical protein
MLAFVRSEARRPAGSLERSTSSTFPASASADKCQVQKQSAPLRNLDELAYCALIRPWEGRPDVTEVQPRGGPTVGRMLLGSQLRRLRTDRGLSREQAGEAIRASEWKIHRLENGQVGFKERDVVDLLSLYGVDDPDEVATFVAIAREANTPGWWHHSGGLRR